MVYATPAGSFGSYAVPIQNFANLATAARAAGFVGIVYDNEPYLGAVWDPIPGYTLAQSQAQALVRGQQTMDAMRAAWPTIQFLAFLGPTSSAPPTSWPTLGSFFVGLVQSTVGTAAQVIDGGEFYALRTPAKFAQYYGYEKTITSYNGPFIPASLQPLWSSTVGAAFGVYDSPVSGLSMDSSVWQTTLTNALAQSDEYVWAYSEQDDWWGTGYPTTPVPADWVAATRQALATAR
jgi:hypothetical protein